MDKAEERITRPIVASELFARDTLREAGRDDLVAWVDQQGIAKGVVQAVARLSVLEGGVVVDNQGTVARQPAQLHALIGGTWHVNITKDGWKVVLKGVALTVGVLKASLGDFVEAGTIVVELLLLIDEVARVVHKLKPEQVEIYLAVKAAALKRPSGATLNDVAACVQSGSDAGDTPPASALEEELERLVMDGVLERTDDGFRCL